MTHSSPPSLTPVAHAGQKQAAKIAAPAIAVEHYRVEHGEGFTMPVVSLTDRRAAGNRLVRFVFQRYLETVLYASKASTAVRRSHISVMSSWWVSDDINASGLGFWFAVGPIATFAH